MSYLKTQLITYAYDINVTEDLKAYNIFCGVMSKKGIKKFCASGNYYSRFTSGEVYLNTDHFFNNQWNVSYKSPTNAALRVFDWAEESPKYSHSPTRCGHYLIVTDEMKQLRDTTYCCGFCGMRYRDADKEFCDNCLGSPYLNESELHLLRLIPISLESTKRESLSSEEFEKIHPEFVEAKLSAKNKKIAKQKTDIEKTHQTKINQITTEYKGMMWLLENGIDIENCIYYSGEDTFCFGWRNPLNKSVEDKLKERLTDFPYKYRIKTC